jgi:3-hydroxymyristoyl/3-hydroxydecanoyl-(acyl carrier protein) dehydratase
VHVPLPHQEPFRFVSRLEELQGERARFAFDLPRLGETFGLRLSPELLCVEAMAQAAAAFHGLSGGDGEPEPGVLASVDKVRFHHPLPRPGDTLRLLVTRKKVFGPLVMLDGEVWLRHRMVAQAALVVKRGAASP